MRGARNEQGRYTITFLVVCAAAYLLALGLRAENKTDRRWRIVLYSKQADSPHEFWFTKRRKRQKDRLVYCIVLYFASSRKSFENEWSLCGVYLCVCSRTTSAVCVCVPTGSEKYKSGNNGTINN